jgi:hypothetical protein
MQKHDENIAKHVQGNGGGKQTRKGRKLHD